MLHQNTLHKQKFEGNTYSLASEMVVIMLEMPLQFRHGSSEAEFNSAINPELKRSNRSAFS